MTLAEIVREKLAEAPCHTGRHDLGMSGAGWSLTLSLDRHDELGCLIWELALGRTTPAPAGETLRSWAERVSRQATGLLEPLAVLEIDELGNEALLRSNSPSRRKDMLAYYELLLRGTSSALLRRFQSAADGTSGKRAQAAFALTRDALAKLADDLTS